MVWWSHNSSGNGTAILLEVGNEKDSYNYNAIGYDLTHISYLSCALFFQVFFPGFPHEASWLRHHLYVFITQVGDSTGNWWILGKAFRGKYDG